MAVLIKTLLKINQNCHTYTYFLFRKNWFGFMCNKHYRRFSGKARYNTPRDTYPLSHFYASYSTHCLWGSRGNCLLQFLCFLCKKCIPLLHGALPFALSVTCFSLSIIASVGGRCVTVLPIPSRTVTYRHYVTALLFLAYNLQPQAVITKHMFSKRITYA